MKNLLLLLLLPLFAAGQSPTTLATKSKTKYTQYVNPFIGTYPLTDSAVLGYSLPKGWRSWAGLTFPGASLPNAMVQLSPITAYGSGAGYQYEDRIIYGFAHTNKGHWNLCNIPLLPVSKPTNTHPSFGSHFDHMKEQASPAFYQVYLDDYEINVSLTSTLRCGYHRYEYKNNVDRQILFDLAKANDKIAGWHIEQADVKAVAGYQQTGVGKVYFYAVFNAPIERIEKQDEGLKTGFALVHISNSYIDPVEVKLALSFVSIKNAMQNFKQEIGNKSFEEIRNEGVLKWEGLLSKIQVSGGTEKETKMFYSCLYRSLLWPALRSDVNGEYSDINSNIVKGDFNYYTVPSLWDTYRNKDVLLSILSPEITLDVIKSLKDIGDKTGFIPTFFHGDHAASSITGSFLRGIQGFDVQGTYQLLLRNANLEGGTRPFITEYISKGYVSELDVVNPTVETKAKAGVSKTLEYSYDDYSVAKLAQALGDSANYRVLMQRSKNYKNVFDPSTHFMRGRLENGNWIRDFNPQYPYYEYMYREANAWQVSFYAPHDMKGLISLYGGPESFEAKLDSFFTIPWNPHYIARNIETMIGQYCHGNQPDHEAPFAYHFIGKPEKSQKILDYILKNLYGIGKEGLALSGMDDAGEMSAWYVFNALGLYPFSATDPTYIVTAPLFEEVKWKTSPTKVLTITKPGKGRDLYSIHVNSKLVQGYFVSHDLFINGGKINIETK